MVAKEPVNISLFALLTTLLWRHLLCFVINITIDVILLATYVAVLMLISYGWKITRDRH
jgi:hypothetical protein